MAYRIERSDGWASFRTVLFINSETDYFLSKLKDVTGEVCYIDPTKDERVFTPTKIEISINRVNVSL